MTIEIPSAEAAHTLRVQLLANGYEPAPVDGKAMRATAWTTRRIATEADLTAMEAERPDDRSTGIRTGRVVGVDIDIIPREHITAIEKIAFDVLGLTSLCRVGRKGCLLAYRNETPIPKTTVSTGGHKTPKGENEPGKIEILGTGQQFVAYGIHPDTGKPYEWNGADIGNEPLSAPLSDLPEVTPDKLFKFARLAAACLAELGYADVKISGAEKKQKEARKAPDNVSPRVNDAIAYLKTHAPAVEGHGGDPHTLTTAMHVKDLGVPQDECLTLMLEHYNPRCVPPWDYDELAAKVENAYRYGQNAPGCDAQPLAEEFAPIIAAQAAKPSQEIPASNDGAREAARKAAVAQSPVLEIVRGTELLNRTVPPLQWLIPGWIEKGVTTLFSGAGGSHKSRLAHYWGQLLQDAAPIFDTIPVERAHFVHVSYEDDPDEIARRTQNVASWQNQRECDFEYIDLRGKQAPLAIITEENGCVLTEHGDALKAKLKAKPGHKFVTLDSCYNAFRFVGRAKVNESAVEAVISQLDALCTECDCTVLLLWHPSYAGQERGDASGWSVAWNNGPRARVSIRETAPDQFELKVEKHNKGPKGKTLALRWSEAKRMPWPSLSVDPKEQDAALIDAAVTLATEAAEKRVPITAGRRLAEWQLGEVANKIGWHPREKDIKDALIRAVHERRLVCVPGSNVRVAGYYPPERADELSRREKQRAQTREPADVPA